MPSHDADRDAILRAEDLEHQQLRVLLLIASVSEVPGTGRKLDGLTKLAKLDFLARYRDFEPAVAEALDASVNSVPQPAVHAQPITASPMIRYRYGPWDDQYYPVIGALVGRGLIQYTRGKQGSVAMLVTQQGGSLVTRLTNDELWAPVAERYREIAGRYGMQSGNRLKEAIYESLPELMQEPLGTKLS